MDPLSITASIIAILQLTAKVGMPLGDAKDASTGRIQFTTEISNLSSLLVNLLSLLEEDSNDPWHANVRQLGGKDGLVYQYRVALEQLKNKLSDAHHIQRLTKTIFWAYIKEDAECILSRVERLKSLVLIALEMDHFKLSQSIGSRIDSIEEDNKTLRTGVNALQLDQGRQKHRLIMDWLSSDDFAAQHANFLSRRQADTGLWFLNSPKFTEWVHGAGETLFCPGIPGAGKTVMTAIAVDHLHNTVQARATNVGVAYLYCNYKTQADQTTSDLLAAILKQFVQDRPPLAQPISDLYDRRSVRKTKLSLDETLGALRSVLVHYAKVYIVIDALDECPVRNGTRDKLLDLCRDPQQQTDLCLMVTSRDISDIVGRFVGMPQLEVRASNADVRRYVIGNIDRLAKCIQRDDELRKLVQDKVVEAVNGMFLLARLHVDSLADKRTKAKVISALNNLSKGALNDAYSEAIVRINGQLHDDCILAKNVLSWISYAKRPLTAAELCHALAVEPYDEELNLDNIPDVEDIQSVCAGLVTVDEESQVVRLVHYTTQVYLESIRETWHPRAQYEIASTCLTYLCFKPFSSDSCMDNEELEIWLEEHKFLSYSAQHWHLHVAPVEEEISGLAMNLLENRNCVTCVLQIINKHKYLHLGFLERLTALHLSASLGLLHLTQNLLSYAESEKAEIADTTDARGETPLIYAIESGHKDIVELLLSTGQVNVNARNHLGMTPLLWAVRENQIAIFDLLLCTGKIDVDTEDDEENTALIWAAYGGCTEIVELLLRTGMVDVNAKNQRGSTALILAAREGHSEIVELLLRTSNVDVNAKDEDGDTPLTKAAMEGYTSVIELLLCTKKTDVDVKNKRGNTALMLAAKEGYRKTTQVLLSIGKVDINAKNEDGNTALIFAAMYGSVEIVELLLHTDKVDINAKNKSGSIALTWARMWKRGVIVEMLLNAGSEGENSTLDNET